MSRNVLYIAVMALVSYTIRVLPLTLIRKPIRNTFIQSFLYYVPYVTLAADDGYREQSGTEPCSDDSGNERYQSGNRCLRSVDDGRKGHDSQCHVWYIVQKGLNELILDGFTDQCQG